jgi:4'-phosphopantetheinyl transferase
VIGTRVWSLQVSIATPCTITAILSAEEHARAGSFRLDRDRRRYIAAHLGLRRLLGGILGIPPADVPIHLGRCAQCGSSHGKPLLPPDTGLHFSLSHAADLVLYAVSAGPIGVDIEIVPTCVRDLLGALSPAEQRAIHRLPMDTQPYALTQCWVRKEALLKATGEGLTTDPQLVQVGLGAEFGDKTTNAAQTRGFRLLDLHVAPGSAAAVAVTAAEFDHQIAVTTLPA